MTYRRGLSNVMFDTNGQEGRVILKAPLGFTTDLGLATIGQYW